MLGQYLRLAAHRKGMISPWHTVEKCTGVQALQHLHARYQHCFGASRLDRPSAALGQHTPHHPGAGPAPSMMQSRSSPCTSTSAPAPQADPHTRSKGSSAEQRAEGTISLQTRHPYSPYRVRDPHIWI